LLVMVVFSAFFLRMACSICGMDLPSWRRCFVSVVIVTFLSYLVFDFTGYLVMRTLADTGLQVPPWYGYRHWFREPLGLKLAIIQHSAFLRYLPFIFALCAAGVLQVIVLQAQVTFRFGLLIFAMQWGATILTGYILLLVLGVGLESLGWKPGPAPNEQAQAQDKGKQPPPRKGRKVGQRPKKGVGKKTTPAPPEPADSHATGSEQGSSTGLRHDAEAAAAASKEYLEHAGKNLRAYADTYLDEVKEAAAPVTKHLPEPVQQFLERGGWWAIFGVLFLIILLWLWSILKRLAGALSHPRRRRKKKVPKKLAGSLRESLKRIGEAYTEEGPRQVTVKGMPARLRLVVLSPGGNSAGQLTPAMVDRVLDWIKPGLAEVTTGDFPRIKVWPPFYSLDGFATAFAANVPIPGPKKEPTRWVLVAGQVKMGKALVQVGLALHADEATTLRNVKVKGEHWLDIIGVKETRQLAGAR
jgi:hypothetical protein